MTTTTYQTTLPQQSRKMNQQLLEEVGFEDTKGKSQTCLNYFSHLIYHVLLRYLSNPIITSWF